MISGLKNVRILTPKGYVYGNLRITNGKILSIDNDNNFAGIEFNDEVIIVPGFIDEHIHGANGSDCMYPSQDAIGNIAKTIVKEGVTSFLATTMTQSDEVIIKALENIKEYINNDNPNGANVIGIHLEGPFINKAACGAQDKQYIMNPNVDIFKKYQEVSGNNIKFVTVAPEVSGGYELIRYCKENNIVASIGHTKATYEDTLKAIEAGASSLTHCFNAMTGLHHREVGVVGAALLHNELNAELIADGIHVHPKAMEILYKNKGLDNLTLVTDSMEAKWLEDGEYELGGQKVVVQNKEARLVDGTLAGSVLKMIDGVKNSVKYLGISLEEAIHLVTTNPAKKLNVYDHKGSIEIGKDADLVVLNKDLDIVMTIVKGKIVYEKENK